MKNNLIKPAAAILAAALLQGCTYTDTTTNRDPMAFSQGLSPSPYVYETYEVYYPQVIAVPVVTYPVHSVYKPRRW